MKTTELKPIVAELRAMLSQKENNLMKDIYNSNDCYYDLVRQQKNELDALEREIEKMNDISLYYHSTLVNTFKLRSQKIKNNIENLELAPSWF